MHREKMLNLCAALVPHSKNLRAAGPAVLHQLLVRDPRFLRWRLSVEHRHIPQNCRDPRKPFRQRLLEQCYSEGCCGWSRLKRRGQCRLSGARRAESFHRWQLGFSYGRFCQPDPDYCRSGPPIRDSPPVRTPIHATHPGRLNTAQTANLSARPNRYSGEVAASSTWRVRALISMLDFVSASRCLPAARP
jgi:hypothetical protein